MEWEKPDVEELDVRETMGGGEILLTEKEVILGEPYLAEHPESLSAFKS